MHIASDSWSSDALPYEIVTSGPAPHVAAFSQSAFVFAAHGPLAVGPTPLAPPSAPAPDPDPEPAPEPEPEPDGTVGFVFEPPPGDGSLSPPHATSDVPTTTTERRQKKEVRFMAAARATRMPPRRRPPEATAPRTNTPRSLANPAHPARRQQRMPSPPVTRRSHAQRRPCHSPRRRSERQTCRRPSA